jgi:hypothetical protein
MIRISKGFSYLSKSDLCTGTDTKTCISKYKKQLKTVQELDKQHKIFLDSNILLGYYQLPMSARKKLSVFLSKNKDRIYLCDQVMVEYSRHLKHVKQNYLEKVVMPGPNEGQRGVKEQILTFLEDNDDVLNAYPDLQKAFESEIINSTRILKLLLESAENKAAFSEKQLSKAEIEETVKLLQQLPRLELEEKKLLKEEFNEQRTLAENYQPGDKTTSIEAFMHKQPGKIFPGIGDIKKKPANPYGDYYIYHEIIKWIANNPQESPCIFITNDIAKGDWLDSQKKAYIHYLENMYLNSSDIFFILHGEEIFGKVLGGSFEHLVTSEEIAEDLIELMYQDKKISGDDCITPISLQQLLDELFPGREKLEEEEGFWEEISEELVEDYDFNSITELRDALLENYHLLVRTELGRLSLYDQLEAMDLILNILYE